MEVKALSLGSSSHKFIKFCICWLCLLKIENFNSLLLIAPLDIKVCEVIQLESAIRAGAQLFVEDVLFPFAEQMLPEPSPGSPASTTKCMIFAWGGHHGCNEQMQHSSLSVSR